VNNDGFVAADDVLTIINHINAVTTNKAGAAFYATALFLDVDADEYVTASDVIRVINYINSRAGDLGGTTNQQVAEGEASDAYFESLDSDPNAADALWSRLAADAVTSPRRRR
jgi:hypothetical protein